MRFLSLFSGIEAASVAWEALGWECVGVAEIEPFPCAVLAHHYPSVPNLGDVSKITEQKIADLGPIDLIVGGFPCQDLSVAGKRRGLRNEDGSLTRSGLFFDAMRLVRFARERCGLRWLLIENVPGLYSSNGGRDFAALVGEVVGCGFDVPRDGWENAGVAVGPDGKIEWATLDAQFFGLAQRRKRVFALGDFGDWTRTGPVLFEPASLRGDSPPRREAREAVAPTIAARTRGGGGLGTDFDCDGGLTSHTLSAARGSACAHAADLETYIPVAFGGNNQRGAIDIATAVNAHGGPHGRLDFESETFVCATLDANYGKLQGCSGQDLNHGHSHLVTHALRGEGHDASEDGTGRSVPLVPVAHRISPNNGAWETGDRIDALTTGSDPTSHVLTLAFHENQRGEITVNDTAGSLKVSGGKPGQGYPAALHGAAVRRLTPGECERLQGFPENYTRIAGNGWRAMDASETPEECRELGMEVRQTKNGKWRVNDPDGPRYKALGNSFAVPVVRWIGKRIAEVACAQFRSSGTVPSAPRRVCR